MDPNEIIRPQQEETVWVYGAGHKNEGQVAPPNTAGAYPVIRTTVYRRDGRVEVWQRNPDQGPEFGVLMPAPISYTDDKIAAQFQKDQDKQEQASATVSAPPTQPNIVTRNPDGSLATQPNPNYTPPASETDKGPPGGKGYIDEEIEGGNRLGWNPATRAYDIILGPTAWKPSRTASQQQPQTVATSPTEPYIVERLPDGSLRSTKNPNYRGPEQKAGSSLQIKGGDGRTYLVPIGADGKPGTPTPIEGIPAETPRGQPTQIINDPNTGERSEIIRNPDGTVREVRPLPGSRPSAPSSRAPSLPQIVVGSSQDALRRAYDEIQAAVDRGERTAAWGENRRKEVFQAAQLTVQEAQLHEQSRQFNQTQAQSLANTKLQYGQNALESALRFALSINGKIKQGSSAGANLFRNVFMLQMQMARDSGIYDVVPGGGQSSVGRGMPGTTAQAGNPQTRPPLDIGNPEKLAASADEAAANIAAGLEASGGPREMTPATATTGQPAGAAPAAQVPATPTMAPQPATPVTPAPQSAVPVGPPPVAGQVRIRRNAPGPGGGTPGYETNVSQRDLDSMTPEERARWDIITPSMPSAAPAPQAMTRPTLDPAAYGHTPDNPLVPRTDTAPRFAALEQFRMNRPPFDPSLSGPGGPSLTMTDQVVVPPNPADPAMGMPPAIRAARIAATPPWRIDPAELPALIDEFGPDVVYGVPGMTAKTGVA